MTEKNHLHHKSNVVLAVLIALGIATVLSWSWYFVSVKSSVKNLEKKLAKTVQERSDAINAYIQKQVGHGFQRAEQPELIAALEKLATMDDHALQDPSLTDYTKKITLFLEEYSDEDNYRNSLLIDRNGRVLYSDFAPQYVLKNLLDVTNKTSALSESFQRVIMSLTEDVAEFSFDPVLGKIALFVSIPIFNKGKVIGVLAQEIDTDKIYTIIHNYIGLGKTGDVILGKKVPDGILYISRSRTGEIKPFKNYLYYNRLHEVIVALPIVRASTGHKGFGIHPDQANKSTVAAWQFVPIANWGIVAKIDVLEIQQSLRIWLFLSIFLTIVLLSLLGVLAYNFAWLTTLTQNLHAWMSNKQQRNYIKLFILLCAFSLLCLTVLLYIRDAGKELEEERGRSVSKIEDAKAALVHMIKEYERVGQSIAYDMYANRLKKDELVSRLKTDLAQKSDLYGITIAYEPYAFEKDRRLYAPYVYRTANDSVEVQYLDESFDYTKEEPKPTGAGSSSWAWYRQALYERNVTWFDTYTDPLTGFLLIGYSIPFYASQDKERKTPAGVINVIFKTTHLQNLLARLDVDTKGYVYLLSKNGTFIYYPLRDYITKQRTIYDLAQEQGNEKLISIFKQALKGKREFDYYYDAGTGEKIYTFFEQIKVTQWAIGIVLPIKEVSLSPMSLRQHYIKIIFTFLLFLFALLWFFGGFVFQRPTQYAAVATILMIFSLGSLFYAIRSTFVYEKEDNVVIDNPIALNQFLYEMDNYAEQVSEKPSLKIPFGIYVYSSNHTGFASIAVSAYVWLKFPKNIDEKLIQPPQFPQALRELRMHRIYDVVEGDSRIVGWIFNNEFTQKFDYSKYPLDVVNVRIDLEYPDLSKNITLIPSLEDYVSAAPERMPGIGTSQGLVFPEFIKKRAFFTFETEIEDSDMGLQAYANVTKHVYLSYNLSLTRYLLYDFIVLILPLLIIFFSLFTIFTMSERDKKITPLMALSAYTGLVFTAIILHGSFRGRQATSQLLYIEYLFFMLYITFVVLVLHALIKMNKDEINRYVGTFYSVLRTFFWPVELFLFMLITMIVFYSN